MKNIYKYSFAFLSAFMLASSLTAYADGEKGTDAIHLNKTITKKTGEGYTDNDGVYTISLETFVTGKSITDITYTATPVDLVLVLDVSGSMDNGITDADTFTPLESASYSFDSVVDEYYIKDPNSDTYYQVEGATFAKTGAEYTYYYLTFTRNSTTYYLHGSGNATTTLYKDITSSTATIYNGTLYRYQNNYTGSAETANYSYDNFPTNTRYYRRVGSRNTTYHVVTKGSVTEKADTYGLRYTDSNNIVHYLTADGDVTTSPTVGVATENDAIWTGVLYKRTAGATNKKIDILKDAVEAFIDIVGEKAASDEVDHRIAIVKFAGNSTNTVGNDKYTVSSRWGTNTYNYSQIVSNFVSSSGFSNLKSTVNSFSPAGATQANYGMNHALSIINGIPADRKSNKVVVMFTDGTPTSNSSFEKDVANGAIDASLSMKADEVTVFTVGIFDNETNNIRTYMNYVSSNYPNAEDMDTPGTGGSSSNGFYQLSDGSDLTSIFQKIAEESTEQGDSYPLDATSAAVIDVVSDNFILPEGAENIRLSVESCTGYDEATKEYIWAKSEQEGYYYVGDPNIQCTISNANNKLQITGFDYTKDDVRSGATITSYGNWVGPRTINNVTTYRGNKLVITFDVNLNPDYQGGYAMPSNDIKSGVYVDKNEDGDYDDDERVKPYPVPVVDFPSICILKEGLEVGESAIFHITADYFNDSGMTDGVKDLDCNVVLTQTENASHGKERCFVVMKELHEGIYTVEETNWSWMYDTNPSDPITFKVVGAKTVNITAEDVKTPLEVNGLEIGHQLTTSITVPQGTASGTTTQMTPFVLLADNQGEYGSSAISILYHFVNTRSQSGKPARAEAYAHNQFVGGKASSGTETGTYEEEEW